MALFAIYEKKAIEFFFFQIDNHHLFEDILNRDLNFFLISSKSTFC